MIESFGNSLAEDLFEDRDSKAVKHFPPELRRSARRKLQVLHEAEGLQDLRALPGNRVEALRGTLKRYYSIRINDRWRVVFRWESGNALKVQVIDYH